MNQEEFNKMIERVKLYSSSAEEELQVFYQEVTQTLSRPNKSIPAKYSYGGAGTQLWFEMLQDPNYYLFRCDEEILTNQWKGILDTFGTQEFNLVDLGAGDGRKTKILIDGALSIGMKPTYVGVDIQDSSNDVLEEEMARYKGKIDVKILTATYEQAAEWISQNLKGINIYFLIGGTIGSFTPEELDENFRNITKFVKDGEYFFLGQDLVKDPAIITKAYSQPNYPIKGSPQGIINVQQLLGGSLGPQCFYPHLIYDPYETTIKDMMISKSKQTLRIRDKEFILEENEPILVFSSRKTTIPKLSETMLKFGLNLVAHFEDSKNYFTNAIFRMKKSE